MEKVRGSGASSRLTCSHIYLLKSVSHPVSNALCSLPTHVFAPARALAVLVCYLSLFEQIHCTSIRKNKSGGDALSSLEMLYSQHRCDALAYLRQVVDHRVATRSDKMHYHPTWNPLQPSPRTGRAAASNFRSMQKICSFIANFDAPTSCSLVPSPFISTFLKNLRPFFV